MKLCNEPKDLRAKNAICASDLARREIDAFLESGAEWCEFEPKGYGYQYYAERLKQYVKFLERKELIYHGELLVHNTRSKKIYGHHITQE